MKTFADFGIDISGKTGTQVKIPCPKCSSGRKKSTFPCCNVNTEELVWFCHHCGFSGSLKHGEDRSSLHQSSQPKTYRKPTYSQEILSARTVQWFARRGIPEHILTRRQISAGMVYMPQVEEEVRAIRFPYFSNGEVVNCKWRDAEKNFRMESGCQRVLYGLDDIAGNTLCIVEGECDALSLEVAGYTSVVSVPDGAPSPGTKNYSSKFDFLDTAMDKLTPIKKHIIAVDMDAPGQVLAEELARRLGPEKCYRVHWPQGCKDANDVLVAHGVEEVRRCVEAATPWPVKGIITIAMLGEALDAMYEHGIQRGVSPGWMNLEQYYRVQLGELTIVTGVPAHGKTRLLSHMLIHLATQQNWSFAVFSPEATPQRYIKLLLEQYTGKPFDDRPGRMTQPELWEAQEWLGRHFCILAPEDDTPTIPRMLELARIQVSRMGINGVVLDPWSWIGKSPERGQLLTHYVAEQLRSLKHFCTSFTVHIWLVAHPTKLKKDIKGEYDGLFAPPTLYDVSDSAAFFNMTDNGICVWRNTQTGTRESHVIVQKIKFEENGQLGDVILMYDPSTKRYYDPGTEPGFATHYMNHT